MRDDLRLVDERLLTLLLTTLHKADTALTPVESGDAPVRAELYAAIEAVGDLLRAQDNRATPEARPMREELHVPRGTSSAPTSP